MNRSQRIILHVLRTTHVRAMLAFINNHTSKVCFISIKYACSIMWIDQHTVVPEIDRPVLVSQAQTYPICVSCKQISPD